MKFRTITKLKARVDHVIKNGPRLFFRGVRILRKRILPSANVPTDRVL